MNFSDHSTLNSIHSTSMFIVTQPKFRKQVRA